MRTTDDLLKDVLAAHDEPWNLDMKLVIGEIRAYLLDKNPSTSISSEEVDKSTQKRLAIQKAKKPMTGEKRTEGYIELEGTLGPDAHLWSFLSGICWAEKHHGISGEDK